ncbi:MAG: nicotinamide riboside transporter PnuC [Cyclobacteriaceae bacterium]|nr:nicotinamide mononucleotide transporter [Cyclobacteriaceae bacterium]MCH8517121.1 nicotinamide riboside transporter PnuC [Cyclobacteriaceae bacterium]
MPWYFDLYRLIELIALVLGVLCVYLGTKENIWSWPIGIVATGMAAYIFTNEKLYLDFGLHLLYIAIGFYGWYSWLARNEHTLPLIITQLNKVSVIKLIFLGVISSLGVGYIFDEYTNASLAYWDSFTTCFSIIAQILFARKIIDNWYFWIFINIASFTLYFYKGLYFLGVLYIIYLLLAFYGLKNWTKSQNIRAVVS